MKGGGQDGEKEKENSSASNRYGSICFLGKGRRRPFGVYPPATERIDGKTVRPKALGYCETYEEARDLLALYHKGLSLPDVELLPKKGPTFAEVYEKFYTDRCENPGKPLSESAARGYRAAFSNASVLHGREFSGITYPDLQAVLDGCDLGTGSLANLVKLFHGMYSYANKMELVDKDPSRYVEIRKADTTEHGEPFTDDELKILWRDRSDRVASRLLVMCYSGYRVGALKGLEVHLEPDWFFKGGVKTAAGKDRIVPIHSAIRPIVAGMDKLMPVSYTMFRRWMTDYCRDTKIAEHTPHDCRHTFSMLCERYGVPEADRKRLMGHSFGGDITNGVYGHRTVEELRESIEKIQVADLL